MDIFAIFVAENFTIILLTMRKICCLIFGLIGIGCVAAKGPAFPVLTFVNEGDTVRATYDDAPRMLYDANWFVDYNSATDKLLADEGLGQYRSIEDDVLARVAISRMFMNSRLSSLEPLMVTMQTSRPADLQMSPRVYLQMSEMLAMLNRAVADEVDDRISPSAMDEEHAFRDFGIMCRDNDIWEKEALNPSAYVKLSFTEGLPKDKGPQNILEDTLGVIDYNPWRYAYNPLMPPARELDWFINDMTAKYRFFSHVIRTPEGQLVQTSTADDLRLSPAVWFFLTEALKGLNEQTDRMNDPIAAWTDSPEEAERMSREFFMAKNRGASSRIFDKKGKLQRRLEPTKPTSRPTRFEYRLDAFNRNNGTWRQKAPTPAFGINP